MGVYLNPSSKLFENTINSEIYVDKSGLLNFTNSRINITGNKTLIDYCNEIYYVTKKAMQEIFCWWVLTTIELQESIRAELKRDKEIYADK